MRAFPADSLVYFGETASGKQRYQRQQALVRERQEAWQLLPRAGQRQAPVQWPR